MQDFDFLHKSFGSSEDERGPVLIKMPFICLVEDDLVLGQTIKKFLEKTVSLPVHFFSVPNECLNFLEGKEEDNFCLISDISFDEGNIDGLKLVDLLGEKNYNFLSIVMTGFASIETAINATKKGVFHYLTKPFELSVLSDLIVKGCASKFQLKEELLKRRKKNNESENLKPKKANLSKGLKLESPKESDIFCGMVGRSQKMKKVFERIQKVANSNSTVLIQGASGTGKELVAKGLHKLSLRSKEDIVSVNCGAIPNELLESELFGHLKGSFTGAIADRKGRFEMANKGTIFLDEIGDMPFLLQVKLLRVLQSREIEKVGDNKSMPIDVRIITATHRNLEESVSNGSFREDLFYRLNVIPVMLPSLSERKEDIPLLISYFLSRFVSADGRNSVEFDEGVLDVLVNYPWPGNVRELENLIERLIILKGGSLVKTEDLPDKFLKNLPAHLSEPDSMIELTPEGIDLKKTLSDLEDSLIIQALELTEGNKNKASKLLQMNRTTLIEKIKKKDLLGLQSQ